MNLLADLLNLVPTLELVKLMDVLASLPQELVVIEPNRAYLFALIFSVDAIDNLVYFSGAQWLLGHR